MKLFSPALVVCSNSSNDSAIHIPLATEDFSASFPQQGTHPPLACYLSSVWGYPLPEPGRLMLIKKDNFMKLVNLSLIGLAFY